MSGPDRVPRGLVAVGWLAAAGLVVLGKVTGPRRAPPLGPPLGPPGGRLADGLPPVQNAGAAGLGAAAPDAPAGDAAGPAAPVVAAPGATTPTVGPAAAPATSASSPPVAPAAAATPTPAPARPRRLLAELEAAFAARDSAKRAARRARAAGLLLPRPVAELRRAASPLIMPRLALPRVLAPEFRALRALTARARPGQPVHVRLTAYCLTGRTRRGSPTRPGIVAADTRIFPMARHVELYAAGRFLGRFRVEDTGGGVRGPHIDIWTPDCADARRFGSRAGVASLVGLGRD